MTVPQTWVQTLPAGVRTLTAGAVSTADGLAGGGVRRVATLPDAA